MQRKRLAIIHTHPVQYNVPWFIKLQQVFDIKVFYTWAQTQKGYWDKKFNRFVRWDLPLTEGYKHEFIRNISPRPAPNTLWGTINPGIKKQIKAFAPDFILVYGWKNLSHLSTMISFHGKIPILFRGDSTILDVYGSAKDKIRSTLLKRIYKHVDYALYVGTENKKYFLAHGLKEEQLIFVPHAVNNDHFSDKTGQYSQQALQWRQNLGLKKHNLTFLYAGKFEPKKNLFTLIKGFINNSNPDHRLILVGNGPEEHRLKQMAQADKRIIFLPFQNQSKMPVVYRLGHVFVLPSAWGETWGLSVNEAMASGRAIITSNKVGCSTDLVKSGTNGYIFDNKSTEHLTRIMESMTIDKAQDMGKASKEIIKSWSYDSGLENLKTALINNQYLKGQTK